MRGIPDDISVAEVAEYAGVKHPDIVDVAMESDAWVVCPSCDEIVPRREMNEHVCPVEGYEDE